MGIQMSEGAHGHGQMSEPNIVPLIDILLVLIIIFMVVTPMTPKGLNALVPQPPPEDQEPDVSADERTVVIRVECSNPACTRTNVKINEEQHTWDTLGPRLDEIFKTRAEKVAFVQGDDNLEFQQVARAIDITKGLGIDKIGLITAKVAAGE